ncbi:TetR/AcrR family transcriptional regulator [Rhodococcus sp. B50]|uniref:TetR/AcrR family transcriptional regulator n=1 Tax=Rhodococcus sp. B50 TaxID=2682847 RepID=UPI001A0E5348|nr:TetR/AcrR family transcriptional regulator [Rhodococcus sp. B50]MBS9374583.1 putative HTH-type transcriptional regulator [Rhodococcus sp. B50]
MTDILRIGREHLATHGAAALSLRAVARDLGVVSSAVYRYVSSRDELLTLLVVDAYEELGDTVDRAVEAVDPSDHRERFLALGRAVRAWALAEPARYGLLFGSPVPGYAAPAERTTAPGIRVVLRLARILDEAHAAGDLDVTTDTRPPESLGEPFGKIRNEFSLTVPDSVLARGIWAWPSLFGVVSFEVFGQYGPDTFPDRGVLFEHHLDLLAHTVGFRPTRR